MMGFAGSSMALFAVVWSVICLVSAALVLDTMLRDSHADVTADGIPQPEARIGALETPRASK